MKRRLILAAVLITAMAFLSTCGMHDGAEALPTSPVKTNARATSNSKVATDLDRSPTCGTTECAYFGRIPDAEYERELRKNDAIFEGEILSQSEPITSGLANQLPYRELTVKVLRSWKGVEQSEVHVRMSYSDRDCLEKGENGTLIFYANKIDGNALQMDWCSKYSFVDSRTRMILGEGTTLNVGSERN